jgi:hypothetical protein
MSANSTSFRPSSLLTAAAIVLSLAGPSAAESVCGDVNSTSDVTSTDALLVLRKAVGQNLDLVCRLENEFGETEDFHETPVIQPNILHGFLINVSRLSTITHYGIITRQGGASARMALYTDDNGSPGTLVSGTLQTDLVLGAQEIPAAMQKGLAPGNYWLTANFGTATEVAGDVDSGEEDVIKFREQSYLGMPGTFGEAQQYTGQRLNYWIKVLN